MNDPSSALWDNAGDMEATIRVRYPQAAAPAWQQRAALRERRRPDLPAPFAGTGTRPAESPTVDRALWAAAHSRSASLVPFRLRK
jgi:hypothetical protein